MPSTYQFPDQTFKKLYDLLMGADSAGGNFTDYSGSIAAGGVAQQVMAANPARRYLLIQNVSLDTLWINFGVAAVQDQPSIKLVPDAAYELSGLAICTQAVSIIGPTTAAKFVAKEG